MIGSKQGLVCLITVLLGSAYVFACKPQVNWAPSVSFCQGNSLILNATNANATYYWSTGATTPTINVSTAGTYWVQVTNPCGSASDTIQVYVDQPVLVNLGKDRTLCSTGNTTLTAPYSPSSTYLWQDGSTGYQYNVTQSGTYWVKVSNGCGDFKDTVAITLVNPPNISLGNDVNLCNNSPYTLSIPAGQGGNILWSNGSHAHSITVTNTGTYWVQVSNPCGVFRDSINVFYNQGQYLNLGDTLLKCASGVRTITPNVSGGSYLWSTGVTSRSLTVLTPGLYWLKYTDACGVYYDSVYVVNSGRAQVNLGNDTTVCKNANYLLDAGNPGSQYLWSTGATTQHLLMDTTNTYWVGVNNGCGWMYDTIHVDVVPTPRDYVIADTIFICNSTSTRLDAGYWGSQSFYLWDDGTTARHHLYSSAGSHSVTFGNQCDTLTLQFYTEMVSSINFNIGPDTTVCSKSYYLSTGLPSFGNRFLWSTGDTLSSTTVTSTNTYFVKVTNACGVYYDTVKVIFQNPPGIIGNRNIHLCAGSATQIVSPSVPNTSYLWSTGDTTNSITVNQAGQYYLTATNFCDTVLDTANVSVVYPINFSLGPDTVVCEPNVVYLDATGLGADSVRWSTGSHNGGLPVFTTGTYWVELYNGCGVFTDTIHIQVNPLPHRILSDVTICSGSNTDLTAAQPQVSSYQWSTGAVTPSINVTQAGWYYVSMSNSCGTVIDSAYVQTDQPIPQFDLGHDTVFCQGSLLLDPGHYGGATYTWQDGNQNQTYLVDHTGKYYVTATNSCNSISDTIIVLITGPPRLVLGTKVRFCGGTVFTLNAQNPGSTYLWNTGDTTQTLAVDTSGIFWVTIENDCGKLTDTVEVITEYPLNRLELGNDTVICQGNYLTLDTRYPGENALWNDGSTDQFFVVKKTGTYWVKLTNSCGWWSDTIFVEVQDVPVFNLGNDTVICNSGGSVTLAGPLGMDRYLWSNGDTNRSTTFYTNGKKALTVSNLCFSFTDSILLKGEDPIVMDLGKDTVLCYGQSLFLSPGNISYPITWDTPLKTSLREVTRSGVYWASARNSCGVFSDTIKVRFDYPLDPPLTDTLVCREDSAVFNLEGLQYDVEWFDGSHQKLRKFAEEGTYSATITNTCGTFTKDFEVTHTNCDCPFFVADAFSPNNDGLNDEFIIKHSCDLSQFRIRIFNRWGEEVYSSMNVNAGWDGTVQGKPAPMAVYNYTVQYGWVVYGTERIRNKRGIITLIR